MILFQKFPERTPYRLSAPDAADSSSGEETNRIRIKTGQIFDLDIELYVVRFQSPNLIPWARGRSPDQLTVFVCRRI
jgi:hypothetical protein